MGRRTVKICCFSCLGISYGGCIPIKGYIIGVLYVDHIEQNDTGWPEMAVLANLSQSYKAIYSEPCRYFEPRAEFSMLSRLFFLLKRFNWFEQ